MNGFEGIVRVPWGQKIAYKYVVDGRWTTTDDQPTEIDSIGNLNNVLNAPARPATPKAPTLSTPEPPSKPSGQLNGIFTTAKSAAVAMVEAIAPGTTQTPVEARTAEPGEAQEAAAPPAHAEPESAKAHENTPVKTENGAAVEAPHEEKHSDVTPTSAPDAIVTPGGELTSEAVLPPAAQEAPKAPEVPVTVLPLAETAQEPLAQGGVQKPLETVVVDGSATAGTAVTATSAAVEPSTHTPAAPVEQKAGAPEGATVVPEPLPAATTATQSGIEASTHTPVPPVESEKTNGAAATAEAPAAATAEPAKATTNGANGTHAPEATAVPLPPTPATNGKPSATAVPKGSPSKEKKHAFPSFGRHRRQSSSTASMSTNGPDEHGSMHQSPSRRGSQKDAKRRTSFFGKLKEIFSDEHHKAKK